MLNARSPVVARLLYKFWLPNERSINMYWSSWSTYVLFYVVVIDDYYYFITMANLVIATISFLVYIVITPAHTAAYTTTAISSLISRRRNSLVFSAPKEALPEIVISDVFPFSKSTIDEDPRLWVPQTDSLSFRPLCLCVSQGYYVNLLKFKGGGMLSRHRHSSPVHALTLKGSWKCENQTTNQFSCISFCNVY